MRPGIPDELQTAQSLCERIDELGASNNLYQGENRVLNEQSALRRLRFARKFKTTVQRRVRVCDA